MFYCEIKQTCVAQLKEHHRERQEQRLLSGGRYIMNTNLSARTVQASKTNPGTQ